MLSGRFISPRLDRTLKAHRDKRVGMVDYGGLFVSKAGESRLLVVFSKRLIGSPQAALLALVVTGSNLLLVHYFFS
jgi:hypothetical protein